MKKILAAVLLACSSLIYPVVAAEEATTSASETFKTKPQVVIETSKGDITLELFPNKSPITTENFLYYVNNKHYDGTLFHRVIKRFMIQGGGFNAKLEEKQTREPIVNESKNRLRNRKYTVAMARTPDPDSARAQFFINVRNNINLDYRANRPGYAVFGKVIKGMEVVDEIARQRTTSLQGFDDFPKQPIFIKRAYVINQSPDEAEVESKQQDQQ